LTARIDDGGVTLDGGGRSRRLEYVDCEEAEDAGGLIYLWPRDGAPNRPASPSARRRRSAAARRADQATNRPNAASLGPYCATGAVAAGPGAPSAAAGVAAA
jgi:hypothetical protein